MNTFLDTFDCFFWDLDGTLTESAEGIIHSVRHALARYGITEPNDEKLTLFVGPPLLQSFQEFYGFSEEQAREAMGIFREYFEKKGIFENSVYDGIPETLAELKARGKRLFIATAKPEPYMLRILERFKLAEYFEFAGGSDFEETRSEKWSVIKYVIAENNLEEAQKSGSILMIGDRKHDVVGAHKNGIPCCGVLWGYGSRQELESCNADFIIQKPAELIQSGEN